MVLLETAFRDRLLHTVVLGVACWCACPSAALAAERSAHARPAPYSGRVQMEAVRGALPDAARATPGVMRVSTATQVDPPTDPNEPLFREAAGVDASASPAGKHAADDVSPRVRQASGDMAGKRLQGQRDAHADKPRVARQQKAGTEPVAAATRRPHGKVTRGDAHQARVAQAAGAKRGHKAAASAHAPASPARGTAGLHAKARAGQGGAHHARAAHPRRATPVAARTVQQPQRTAHAGKGIRNAVAAPASRSPQKVRVAGAGSARIRAKAEKPSASRPAVARSSSTRHAAARHTRPGPADPLRPAKPRG